MSENYLITGYHGTPHVTAENDRGIHAAIFGPGRFVLPVGEMFRAEYIGNNTVRMYDGKLMDNGAAAGIPAGRYIDLLIPEAGQGMNRNDLIVFEYNKNPSTLVESGFFTVIKGTETTGTAKDPTLSQSDLLSDVSTLDQMALWRVPVSAAVISAPVRVFSVSRNLQTVVPVVDAVSTDGFAYTATLDEITNLHNGLTFTMIPNTESTTTAPTLNLNGLGAKVIRRRVSGKTGLSSAATNAAWLSPGYPVTVTYDGASWVAENIMPNANDLYGRVPIESGGTGGGELIVAQKNLQIYPAIQSSDHPGHYSRTMGEESEWLNPPMVEGVEYRTTERFAGAPVYTKIVKGNAPEAGTKGKVTIAFGASGLLRIECFNAMGTITPATAPYSYEISSTILRGIIDNTESKWLPADPVVFRAWYIRGASPVAEVSE